MRSGKIIPVDSIEKLVGIAPGDVVGIADPEDMGVVLFCKGMDFFIPEAKGINKRGDRYA